MVSHPIKVEVPEKLQTLIPAEKLAALVEAFGQIDLDQDGKVQFDEFLNASLVKEKNRLLKVFQRLDQDQDGAIEFIEFVAAREPNFSILSRFQELDRDQNDLLSLEEALEIADRLVLPLNPEQVRRIVAEADQDGDGQVTYYEYLGAIAHIGFQ